MPACCRLLAGSGRPSAAILASVSLTLTSTSPHAQSDTSHHGDLAQQLQNPIASIISVPFQNNFEFRGGPRDDGFAYTLNVQPVIPFQLSPDWTVLSRTILPLRYTERVSPNHEFGLGDVSQTFFLSPRSNVPGFTYGFGPTFLLPTATRPAFQSRQFGAGPAAVVVQASGPWTIGALANHTWSVADSADRRGRPTVNQTLLQPLVGYNFGRGLTANVQAEATYDWTARQWTVPLAVAVNQLVPIGGVPVNFGVAARYWLDGPSTAPEWGLRFQATLVLR